MVRAIDADLVVAIGVPHLDVGPAFGEHGEGVRDGLERLGDTADQQTSCHNEREQGGDAGSDRHGINRLPQHAVEFVHAECRHK